MSAMPCPGCIAALGTCAGLYGFSAVVRLKTEWRQRRAMQLAAGEDDGAGTPVGDFGRSSRGSESLVAGHRLTEGLRVPERSED